MKKKLYLIKENRKARRSIRNAGLLSVDELLPSRLTPRHLPLGGRLSQLTDKPRPHLRRGCHRR